LDQKLRWLAKYAEFAVNINSVIGTCVQHPEDAAPVAKRAGELGLVTTVGIHDGSGQLRPVSEQQQRVYEEIVSVVTRFFSTFAYYNQFQKNLARGLPNAWHCHGGSRYLYICENGLVRYCSQQRGFPGIPLVTNQRRSGASPSYRTDADKVRTERPHRKPPLSIDAERNVNASTHRVAQVHCSGERI